ncbi:curli production assembly/transport protein CsgE [Vibrio europaeus]|uniref:Curli production assembly/transport component CsgE n=1 Tax=Vibrio europaeus TaxID=300876 RepID=A0AAE7AZI8_9VIBR|nr:curli production assembly/transport protein CsgE [Vibrio europaeus]MDC5805097.1 curli production assembly/transport protein CsgE [Vibrio europaeus]MDC5811599.1 curli production assembly/transport protein CsgE [Vibrio europaeus]MDC5826828.1 curli production assembly/transport protein CsgE [Vibrio europaeus]MDC5832194.1 curli production assembly/transport protein CsgE [Vibrio europaeus]MDC5835149.1 curli production assembly/transport protein CsgE [Vibrio europaeus]
MNLAYNMVCYLLIATSFTTLANVDNDVESSIPVNDENLLIENEVNGLIIDRTMTRLGDDFYFYFSQLVNERHGSLKENLTVKERPTALSGSIISIFHRGKIIYRTALSPGRKHAEDKAREALNILTSYLIRWKSQLAYQDTFDLERDEF